MKIELLIGNQKMLSVPDCIFLSLYFKRFFQQLPSKKFHYMFALEAQRDKRQVLIELLVFTPQED